MSRYEQAKEIVDAYIGYLATRNPRDISERYEQHTLEQLHAAFETVLGELRKTIPVDEAHAQELKEYIRNMEAMYAGAELDFSPVLDKLQSAAGRPQMPQEEGETVNCPSCNENICSDALKAGQNTCPHCQQEFSVSFE